MMVNPHLLALILDSLYCQASSTLLHTTIHIALSTSHLRAWIRIPLLLHKPWVYAKKIPEEIVKFEQRKCDIHRLLKSAFEASMQNNYNL